MHGRPEQSSARSRLPRERARVQGRLPGAVRKAIFEGFPGVDLSTLSAPDSRSIEACTTRMGSKVAVRQDSEIGWQV